MKLVRYEDRSGKIGWAQERADGACTVVEGAPFGELRDTGRPAEIARRLAPVGPVPALFCIGANYRRHIEESGIMKLPEYPVVFMKSPAAIQDPGGPIRLPVFLRSDEVDYEGELVVVIGRACRNTTRADALRFVGGYTCGNDVSARDWQRLRGGGQWCRSKTFDTFAPLGPCLVTPDEIPDPNRLRIRTTLNGELVQNESTADMIFDVPTLIAFLSGSTTLPAGTVIMTGTPSGVGMARKPPLWLKAGDDVAVEIEKIGILRNRVENEPA